MTIAHATLARENVHSPALVPSHTIHATSSSPSGRANTMPLSGRRRISRTASGSVARNTSSTAASHTSHGSHAFRPRSSNTSVHVPPAVCRARSSPLSIAAGTGSPSPTMISRTSSTLRRPVLRHTSVSGRS